jgi:hypothetical protein
MFYVSDAATGELVEVIPQEDVRARYVLDSATNTYLLREDTTTPASESADAALAQPPTEDPAPPPEPTVEPPPPPQPPRYRIELVPDSRFYSLYMPYRVYDAATGELVGALRSSDYGGWGYVFDPASGTYTLTDGAAPPQLPQRPPWWDDAINGPGITPPP